MAIKSNKKIDFEFEHENDGDTYAINLRLHNSSEYGASIGVLDENGDVAINFPVSMFVEVTEFLIDQGVIEGKKTLVAPAMPVKIPKINKAPVAAKQTTLPKPRIVSQKTAINPFAVTSANHSNSIPVDLEEDNGDDYEELPQEIRKQIANESERLKYIQEAVEGSSPTMSLSDSASQLDLSDDEVANIMQEREMAAKKAQTTVKKIRKKD
jgi:hypothetical protein